MRPIKQTAIVMYFHQINWMLKWKFAPVYLSLGVRETTFFMLLACHLHVRTKTDPKIHPLPNLVQKYKKNSYPEENTWSFPAITYPYKQDCTHSTLAQIPPHIRTPRKSNLYWFTGFNVKHTN